MITSIVCRPGDVLTYPDLAVCSVCGSMAIYPFSICLDCLDWSTDLMIFAPGAQPVFTGCAQGLFGSSAIVTPDERCVCATSGAKNHA